MSDVQFQLQCLSERDLGPIWANHFRQIWPHCKVWYLSEGLLRRPRYSTCLEALETYLPELEPVYHHLVDLVGGSDLAARFLSLYDPPPYMAGCSQAVWTDSELFLVKNYDYSPDLFEKTLFFSQWLKPVIGMLDCTWGLLDGMNGDGLVASLTFGGKKKIGEGFGAPLILRYLLETCSSTAEAMIKISKIPCHMAYNVTLLDASGAFVQAFLAPDTPAVFCEDPVTTNHQLEADWPEYAAFSKTKERHQFLTQHLHTPGTQAEPFIGQFLKPPLYNLNFKHQFGTLYTAVYRPEEQALELRFPNHKIHQNFQDFQVGKTDIYIQEVPT